MQEPEAFPSDQSLYSAIKTVPGFPVVKIGRRVFIDLDRWRQFKAAGGKALTGGWRREPCDAA